MMALEMEEAAAAEDGDDMLHNISPTCCCCCCCIMCWATRIILDQCAIWITCVGNHIVEKTVFYFTGAAYRLVLIYVCLFVLQVGHAAVVLQA